MVMFSELWLESLRECKQEGQWLGSRNGWCKEVIGMQMKQSFIEVKELQLDAESNKLRKLNYDFVQAFADSILAGAGIAETRALLREAGASEKALGFLQEPESLGLPANANTLYGPRIVAQLPAIVEELKLRPYSRRATIVIFDANDLQLLEYTDSPLEVPCTISYSFFLRAGILHMFVSMRSQSLFQVWPIDAFIQGRLLCHLADLLGLEPSAPKAIHWAMASAHLFEHDFKQMHQL